MWMILPLAINPHSCHPMRGNSSSPSISFLMVKLQDVFKDNIISKLSNAWFIHALSQDHLHHIIFTKQDGSDKGQQRYLTKENSWDEYISPPELLMWFNYWTFELLSLFCLQFCLYLKVWIYQMKSLEALLHIINQCIQLH